MTNADNDDGWGALAIVADADDDDDGWVMLLVVLVADAVGGDEGTSSSITI